MAVGIVVGVGCTAVTCGAGVLVCGAAAGALSNLTTGVLQGKGAGEITVDVVSGAAFGAFGGAAGATLGAGAGGLLGGIGIKTGVLASRKAMSSTIQGLVPGVRSSISAFSRKNFSQFISGSRYNIAMEAVKLGSHQAQRLAVATDVIAGALSPRTGIVPAAVANYTPGNWEQLKSGPPSNPLNMISPLLSAGFGRS